MRIAIARESSSTEVRSGERRATFHRRRGWADEGAPIVSRNRIASNTRNERRENLTPPLTLRIPRRYEWIRRVDQNSIDGFELAIERMLDDFRVEKWIANAGEESAK